MSVHRPREVPLDVEYEVAKARALLHNIGFDPHAAQHWMVLGKAIGVVCRIRGCVTPSDALGMCNMHYKRHYNAVSRQQAHVINYTARKAPA